MIDKSGIYYITLVENGLSNDGERKQSNETTEEFIEFTRTLNQKKPTNNQDAEDFMNAHKIFIELNVRFNWLSN